MATVNRADAGGRTRSGGGIEEGSLATKVVLMELVDAARPLSIGELRNRTTLTEATVRSALVALAGVGICEETDPGGDRSPRFQLQD